MQISKRTRKKKLWTKLLLILILLPEVVFSQSIPDSSSATVKKKQLRIATISAAGIYGAGLAVLNHSWYRHSERQSFEFFNDNAEWKQVDKLGHFYSSFYLSYGASRGLQHYGVKPSRADLTGSIIGFALLVPIEIFDGYSDAYGSSVGDLAADAAGSLFYYGQARLWKEVRIKPKFSFHYTHYPDLRPELLGRGAERIVKDYNGQTYWLSVDADKFFRFPKWLNLAVGYGANGMVYARDSQHEFNGFNLPFRQYYLSFDLDPSVIHTRSKVVKTLLFFADMIRIPSPALEYSKGSFRFHPIYF
jgi:uncharacterized protein YfiM (DUF2279 family)